MLTEFISLCIASYFVNGCSEPENISPQKANDGNILERKGIIIMKNPNGDETYKIKDVERPDHTYESCHLKGGILRTPKPGDTVKIETSPYDLTKCRITGY
jgi:hypothetical protein